MAIYYGDSGTNRTIAQVVYGDSGTNRVATQVWHGDAGANRLVYAAINLLGLDPADLNFSPSSSTATYTLTTGGLEQATGYGDNTWVSGIATSEFDVFAQLNSGSLSTGTTGSWLNLGSSRSWSCTQSVIGTKTADLTISIRSASSLTVLASANVVITATVDP